MYWPIVSAIALAVILIEAAHVAGRLATGAACWLPPVRPHLLANGTKMQFMVIATELIRTQH